MIRVTEVLEFSYRTLCVCDSDSQGQGRSVCDDDDDDDDTEEKGAETSARLCGAASTAITLAFRVTATVDRKVATVAARHREDEDGRCCAVSPECLETECEKPQADCGTQKWRPAKQPYGRRPAKQPYGRRPAKQPYGRRPANRPYRRRR